MRVVSVNVGLPRVVAWRGKRVTTVFPRQGHYAADPKALAGYREADVTIDRVGQLLDWDLAGLIAAAR